MTTRIPYDDNVDDRQSYLQPKRWVAGMFLAVVTIGLLWFVLATAAIDPCEPPCPPPPPCEEQRSQQPCEWLSELELEDLAERWWARLDAGLRGERLPETEQAIDTRVEEAFAPVYAHIPEFLDWHYSMAGQYTQLLVVIVTLLEEWGFPRALAERLATSELMKAVFDWLREWEPSRAMLERLAGLDLTAAREQLDRWRQQVDARLLGDLSDRARLAATDVEIVMRAEMRDLVAQRLRNEMDLLPRGGRVRATGPCSEIETDRIAQTYERMLDAAVPETVRQFTASVVATGLFAPVAARRVAAAGAILKGLPGRLTRRLLPRLFRLIGGAGIWILIEILVLYIDEYFTREQFQAELTTLVDEQRAALKADLAARADEVRMTALGPATPAALGGAD